MFGLRVRGQCTRTTGRKGGAVGVKKVVMRPTGGAGAPGAEVKDAGAAAPAVESATSESGAKSSAPKTSETKEQCGKWEIQENHAKVSEDQGEYGIRIS